MGRLRGVRRSNPGEMISLTTPLQRQRNARLTYGYGPIWLRRVGEWVIVEIQHEGKWVEVIREPYDNNFSHCIEPLGIERAILGKAG